MFQDLDHNTFVFLFQGFCSWTFQTENMELQMARLEQVMLSGCEFFEKKHLDSSESRLYK